MSEYERITIKREKANGEGTIELVALKIQKWEMKAEEVYEYGEYPIRAKTVFRPVRRVKFKVTFEALPGEDDGVMYRLYTNGVDGHYLD